MLLTKSRATIVAVGVISAALVGGCGSDDTGGGSASSGSGSGSGKEFKVGILYSTLSTPYFISIKDGATQAAAKAGNVKLTQLQADNDAAKQLDQISQMVAQKADVIVINPVDSATVASGVREAVAAHIPVVTLDRMIPDVQKQAASHVGASAEQAGYEEAQAVCKAKGKTAKWLGLYGLPGNQTTRDRAAGIKRGAKDKGCDLQMVTEKYEQGETTEAAAETVGSWLQKYGKGSVDAIITYADDQAAGALQELKSNKRDDIVVTGAANFGPFHDAICKGDPQALMTVDFAAKDQGVTLIDSVQKLLAGGKLPAWVKTQEVVVDNTTKATC
jgi:ribose transport system substrate-binding protein